MVHALAQIHRVLRPGGVVADLRPDRFASPGQPEAQLPKIYWTSRQRERLQGVLDKTPVSLRKHRAATRTVKQVTQRGFFLLEGTETFSFRYHFKNLGVLQRWLRTVWKESFLQPSVYTRLQMMERRSPAGHIEVIECLRLNILRKR
jgi:hypothetical protein